MTTIYDQLEREHQQQQPATPPPASYHQPDNTPQEAPVSLAQIEQHIRNGVADVETKVHQWVTDLEPHLGQLADLAQNVEASPLVQAALAAVLPPAVEQEIASLIGRLHEQFGGSQPAPAPAEQPSDTPTDVPAAP